MYPHDGAATDYTYDYDADAGTITLNGVGAHLGLSRCHNGGELASVSEAAGIESITYNVIDISEDGNRMTVDIQFQADGGYWTYVLQRGVPDNGDNGGGDNGGETPVETPTDAPAAPTAAQENVLSIFSDAYTDLSGSNFDPDWGQGTDATIETYAGNEVLQYKDLNYQGLEYAESDVSGYNKLHLDYWTADATTINVSLISRGPLENPVALDVVKGSWQSVDINLSEYSTPNLSEVFQLKADGDGTVILDNIYFY